MIKAGVIGVGSMGKNHARVYAELPGVNLAAVADVDEEALLRIAHTYKATPYRDYREMLEKEGLDLVTVAVPTRLHAQVAKDVVGAGVHLLVEKPITNDVASGMEVVSLAREKGVKLTVGHIERFNPAVIELKRRLQMGQLGRMFRIHARRIGPFPRRINDVGVVFDLATHELNMIEYLTDSWITSLYAQIGRKIHASHEDVMAALMTLRDGTLAAMDTNWLTPTKIREITILGERGMFLLNYLTQDLYFIENSEANGQWDELIAIMGVSEGRRVRYEVQREEPLRAEIRSFVQVVQEDQPPVISGEEALRTVAMAGLLLRSGRDNRVIHVENGPPWTIPREIEKRE